MNISTLEQYVVNKNKWRAVFNQKPLSLLNAKDRQAIADSIDSEMSREPYLRWRTACVSGSCKDA